MGRLLALAAACACLTAIMPTGASASRFAGPVGSGIDGRLTLRWHPRVDGFRLDARYLQLPCSDGSTVSVNDVIEGRIDAGGRFQGTHATSDPEIRAGLFFYARGRVDGPRATGRLFMYVDPNDAVREANVRCATPAMVRWRLDSGAR